MRLAAAAAALKQASLTTGRAEAPFSLAFLTDRRRIPNPEPILRALPAGAAVIYRDYDDPRREGVAARCLSICKARGVLFLVAGDADLARTIGADGLHVPARLIGNRESGIGNRIGPRSSIPDSRFPIPGLFTAACHNADDLRRAAAVGADLALLSPAFATKSHPDTDHLGAARFKALAAASPLPVLALGGVDEMNAASLAGENVAGIAGIGAFLV